MNFSNTQYYKLEQNFLFWKSFNIVNHYQESELSRSIHRKHRHISPQELELQFMILYVELAKQIYFIKNNN